MYEDDPSDLVFDVAGEAVFGSHPLGRAIIGHADVVATATREQLRGFHAARYVPASVVIAAAGSIEHEALVELARAAESRVAELAARASAPEPGEPDTSRRLRFLRKDTEQYHLCLSGPGIARDDDRRFALRVLDNILGGTSSSRLFQEVRERRGLAYSVFSFQSLYEKTGQVGLYVGTRPDNLAAAVEVLNAELERFISDPASPAELERSRENVKGRMVLSLESTSAHMNRLGSSILSEVPVLSVDEVIERVDAVTVDDVAELAGLFVPSAQSVAGIGPDEEAFRAALRPLGEDLTDERVAAGEAR